MKTVRRKKRRWAEAVSVGEVCERPWLYFILKEPFMTFRYFVLSILLPACMSNHAQTVPEFELAVVVIKRFEGIHGASDHPYVGYGHRIQRGERLSWRMSEREADALLRKDLHRLCAVFRSFGRDSLVLATLAYNVGAARLLGHGRRPQSRLIAKLKRGDRDIYSEYVSFRCWNGKVIPSIELRRKVEFLLLYDP